MVIGHGHGYGLGLGLDHGYGLCILGDKDRKGGLAQCSGSEVGGEVVKKSINRPLGELASPARFTSQPNQFKK